MSQARNYPRQDADALDTIAFPEPGTVRRGDLRFSHPDLMEWTWPYTVIRGTEDGPHVALISGVHPAEYPAIESNIRFTRNLDPSRCRSSMCRRSCRVRRSSARSSARIQIASFLEIPTAPFQRSWTTPSSRRS